MAKTSELEAAYQATTYRVFLPGGSCDLRVGQALRRARRVAGAGGGRVLRHRYGAQSGFRRQPMRHVTPNASRNSNAICWKATTNPTWRRTCRMLPMRRSRKAVLCPTWRRKTPCIG